MMGKHEHSFYRQRATGEIAHKQEEAVMAKNKTVEVEKIETPEENSVPIAKPGEFDLDKFKAKQTATVANVETLQSPLPVHNMAEAKDFVRLHPDEQNYWSDGGRQERFRIRPTAPQPAVG